MGRAIVGSVFLVFLIIAFAPRVEARSSGLAMAGPGHGAGFPSGGVHGAGVRGGPGFARGASSGPRILSVRDSGRAPSRARPQQGRGPQARFGINGPYGRFGRFGYFGQFGRFGKFGRYGVLGRYGRFGRFGKRRGGHFRRRYRRERYFPGGASGEVNPVAQFICSGPALYRIGAPPRRFAARSPIVIYGTLPPPCYGQPYPAAGPGVYYLR